MIITINSDGGARGNPGPAGIGFIINKDGQIIHQHGAYIGVNTNNVAEYQAVYEALLWLKNIYLATNHQEYPQAIECYLDSDLIVNQLNGRYKIKQAHLQVLAQKTKAVISEINCPVTFTHVYREANREADFLVNQALDQSGH